MINSQKQGGSVNQIRIGSGGKISVASTVANTDVPKKILAVNVSLGEV